MKKAARILGLALLFPSALLLGICLVLGIIALALM